MAYRYITTFVVIATLSGCATAPETVPFVDYPPASEIGQLSDSVITFAAVSSGAAEEVNPIGDAVGVGSIPGALAMAAVKLGLVYWTRTLPPDACERAYSIVGGFGWGATAANIVTLTLAPPLWAAIVAGSAVGIGTGVLTFEHVAQDACIRTDMSVFQ